MTLPPANYLKLALDRKGSRQITMGGFGHRAKMRGWSPIKIPVAYNSRPDASCMAPCLRWWGSIRGPSRQLLAALYKTYRPALGSWPQFPRLPPKHVCPTSSTLMPPNGSCRQLHATARHFERVAEEVSVSPPEI